jgi:hypothetical protein
MRVCPKPIFCKAAAIWNSVPPDQVLSDATSHPSVAMTESVGLYLRTRRKGEHGGGGGNGPMLMLHVEREV